MNHKKSENKAKVLGDFMNRMDEAVIETPLTVFVCGPAVPRRKSKKSAKIKLTRASAARQFVTDRITENGSTVIWGEHFDKREFTKGKLSLKSFTNAEKEVLFADKSADLIIIFPESAGSLAELGGFSLHAGVARKMLVVFDLHRKGDKGFVVQAVARTAKDRKAQVRYYDYKRLGELWKEVNRVLIEYKTRKITSQSYSNS
jgi:hypothetical protein